MGLVVLPISCVDVSSAGVESTSSESESESESLMSESESESLVSESESESLVSESESESPSPYVNLTVLFLGTI